jgi:hypothetical protein
MGQALRVVTPGTLGGLAALAHEPTLTIVSAVVIAASVVLDSRAVEMLLHGFNVRRTYELVDKSEHKLSDNAADVIRHANPDTYTGRQRSRRRKGA